VPTLAAVDLGAQSGRVAVGRLDGTRLSVTEVHRFANVPVRVRGTLHWDILRLYRDVLDGLGAAKLMAGRVDSIGVDSWAVDFGLVDRAGDLLGNPVHYRDARRADEMSRVLELVPARELYEHTGIQLLPINTIFELAAMAADRDPSLAAADSMLLIPDLLHYWLCGSRVAERTNASTTQCVGPRTGSWDVALLERVGVPEQLLPQIVPPATRLGELSADAAEETGLGGTAIIAPATHDTASAVAAIPLRGTTSAYISAGTWSLVGVELGEPLINDLTFAANLTNEAGVDGTVRLLRNVTGLWLVEECRRVWALAGREYSFEELLALASEAPPLRSFIDPNDETFTEPGDMPARIRAFCARSGQLEPVEPGAIVRCILESLALKHAETVGLLGSVTGAAPTEIHLVGGGVRNPLLCQWTADAAGIPVARGPEEATVIGNLLVQAMALGEFSSVAEARQVAAASFSGATYEPQDADEWQDARGRFETATAGREVNV
jgi:rhamnulokinase